MTFLPIDPQVMLMLRPSADGLPNWHTRRISPERVDQLNLLIYAQADHAIFSNAQSIVTDVATDAQNHPHLIAESARRSPCVWVAEIEPDDRPGEGGVRTFRSTNRDGVVTRQLYVDPAAEHEAQRRAV